MPSASLVVERCRITEAVHAIEPLWAEVDCVSTHALLELKALNGEQVTLRLMLADGSWRAWHGYVVQAAQLGADGGLARYRLTLAAWTHWLSLRRDTRIFQDQTAADIVSAVLSAYPQAHFKLDVAAPGPVRALTTQYRRNRLGVRAAPDGRRGLELAPVAQWRPQGGGGWGPCGPAHAGDL